MGATKNNSSENDKKKIFDVAKPGSSEPETGSKPMVIGHKSVSADSSMLTTKEKDSEDNESEQEHEATVGLSPSKKLILKPLTDAEKNGTKNETDATQTKDKDLSTSEVPKSLNIKDSTTIEQVSKVNEKSEASKTVNELEKEKQEAVDLREAKLHELIKSGKYNVDINESKAFNFRSFITTFIVTALGVLLIVAVLIDLDILDIGIQLPFDLL